MPRQQAGAFTSLDGRPDLITLVVAMGIGTFGTGVASIAFTYVAYEISGSLTWSVLVTLVCALPSVLLIPVSSRLVERFDVRAYLIVVLICSAITHVTYAVLIERGWLSLGFLVVSSALTGTVTALTTPGWTMLARQAVADDRLDGFNALASSSMSIGAVAGLLAGGLLYRDHGAAVLFVVNAVTGLLLAAGAALTRIDRPAPADTDAPPTVPWREVARRLGGIPIIRAVLVTELLLLVLAWPVGKLIPQLAHDVSGSSVTYSWLMAAFSGGSAVVGLVMQRQRTRHTHAGLVLQSLVVVTACMAAIGLSGLMPDTAVHLVVLVVLLFLMGLMLGQVSVINSSAIQIATPAEMRGQVFALVPGADNVIQVLAALGIAAIVDRVSVWLVLVVMAVLLGLIVWRLQSHQWWKVLHDVDSPEVQRVADEHHGWQPWGLVLPSFPHLSVRSQRGAASGTAEGS